MKEYESQLQEPWLRGLIEESNYQYNVMRKDVQNGVESLDRILGKV